MANSSGRSGSSKKYEGLLRGRTTSKQYVNTLKKEARSHRAAKTGRFAARRET